MTPQRERVLRTGLAALAAAAAALLVVAGYHPCEGIGPLLVLMPASGVITALGGAPSFRARNMLAPGATAVAVIAFAIGLDYSNSGMVLDGIDQCEPVPGFAGFLLAAFISGIIAGLGVSIALSLAWLGHGVIRLQSRPSPASEPSDAGANHA